ITDDESLFREVLKKLSLGTAILTTSFDLTAIRTEPTINSRIKIGNRNVETINARLLTRVKYSLFIMMATLLIRIYDNCIFSNFREIGVPSTSLIKISLSEGSISLKASTPASCWIKYFNTSVGL